MARLSPQGPFRAFDDVGNPLAFGKLYTYAGGTTTQKPTYNDATETSANTNPVILDAEGYANVWLTDGAYKFVLKDASDATLWTVDDISADSPASFGATITSTSANLTVTEAYANGLIIATGTLTLNLIAAATAGAGFYFIAKNAGSGPVTIAASDNIDGSPTFTLNPGESVIIISDGSTYVSSNYARYPIGMNLLENGNLDFWQRGTSITPSIGAFVYAADRQGVYQSGNVGAITRIAGETAEGNLYACQVAGSAGNTGVAFFRRMESIHACRLINGPITYHARIYASAAVSGANWEINSANVADNFGALTTQHSGACPLVLGWNDVVITVNALDPDCANGLEIRINLGATLTGTRAIGRQKLEVGRYPSAWSFPLRSIDSVSCRSFFESTFPEGVTPAQNAGTTGAPVFPQSGAASTGIALGQFPFLTMKRTASPTITTYNPAATNAQIRNISTNTDWSLTTVIGTSARGFSIQATTPAATAPGNQCAVHWTADAELY